VVKYIGSQGKQERNRYRNKHVFIEGRFIEGRRKEINGRRHQFTR
jgi:hypothetical protein